MQGRRSSRAASGGSAPALRAGRAAAPRRGRRCSRYAPRSRAAALAAASRCWWRCCASRTSTRSACSASRWAPCAAAAIALAAERAPRRLPRRWGVAVALDVAVVGAACCSLVPDLVIFRPEEAAGRPRGRARDRASSSSTRTSCSGRPTRCSTAARCWSARPRSTASTSIYLLARVVPGRADRLRHARAADGALTALWFGAGYGVLRLAGTSRLLSAAAFGVAVVALVFNLVLPRRHAAAVRAAALRDADGARARRGRGRAVPAPRAAPRVAAAAIVGLVVSVWSLEAFAYTAVVFAARRVRAGVALPGARAAAAAGAPGGARRRARVRGRARAVRRRDARRHRPAARLGRSTSPTCASSSFGEPRRPHLRRPALDARRSPSAPATLASAVALVELARRRGPLVERERPALIAARRHDRLRHRAAQLLRRPLAGPHPHLRRAARPLLAGALWLGLLLRTPGRRRAARRGRPAWRSRSRVAVLVVAVAWSSIGDALPAHGARPRRARAARRCAGRSSGSGTRRRSTRAAPAGERALARYMPGERREPRHGRARPRRSRSCCAAAAWTGCSSATRGRRASSPQEELPGLAAPRRRAAPGRAHAARRAGACRCSPRCARTRRATCSPSPSPRARAAAAVGAPADRPALPAAARGAGDRGGFTVVELGPSER